MKKIALLALLFLAVTIQAQSPFLNQIPTLKKPAGKGFVLGGTAPYYLTSFDKSEPDLLPNGCEFELLNNLLIDSMGGFFAKVKINDTQYPKFNNLVCFIYADYTNLSSFIDYDKKIINPQPYYFKDRSTYAASIKPQPTGITTTVGNEYSPYVYFYGPNFGVLEKLPNNSTVELLNPKYELIDGNYYILAKVLSCPNKGMVNKNTWLSVYDIDPSFDVQIDYANGFVFKKGFNRIALPDDGCKYQSVIYEGAAYTNDKGETITGQTWIYGTDMKKSFLASANATIELLNKNVLIVKGFDRFVKIKIVNDALNPANNNRMGFVQLISTDFFDKVNIEKMQIDTSLKPMDYGLDGMDGGYIPEPKLENNESLNITGTIQSEFGDGYARMVGDSTFIGYYLSSGTTFKLLNNTLYDDGVYYLAKVKIINVSTGTDADTFLGKEMWINIDETDLAPRANYDELRID